MTQRPVAQPIFSPTFVRLLIANFAFFSSMWLIVPIVPDYVLVLNGREADIGIVIAAFAITALCIRPFVGQIIDKVGFRHVAAVGAAVYVIAPALYVLSPSVGPLTITRLVHGLGIGFFSTAGGTWVASMVPVNRRGEALGVYSNASMLALAFAPTVAAFVRDQQGFMAIFLAASLVALAALLLILSAQEKRGDGAAVQTRVRFRDALRTDILSLTLAQATAAATWGLVMSFLPIFLLERNLGSTSSFLLTYGVATLIVRLPLGRLSDRAGRNIIVVPAMLLVAVVMAAFTQLNSAPALYALAILYACSFGSIWPTLQALLVDVAPPRVRGSAMGIFTAGFDLGVALGSFIGGLIVESMGLDAAFLALAFFCLAGLAIYWIGAGHAQRTKAAPSAA